MQTFLPYPDFKRSAECLDYRRLGKQRVEAMQLVNAIANGGGWAKHPAALMWQSNVAALMHYHNVMIAEWVRRGFKNTMKPFIFTDSYDLPSWFGNEDFHRSHQSNLVRKMPEHYKRFFPDVRDDRPYVWPKKKGAYQRP